MEKKMGLIDLVFMGMGGCIGAGIFQCWVLVSA